MKPGMRGTEYPMFHTAERNRNGEKKNAFV